MPRFTFSDTADGAFVADHLTETVLASHQSRERARVLVMAANSADRERVARGTESASTYTVEGVSVFVTATDAKWSGGPCWTCGMSPCDWSRPQCRDESDLPEVTITLPGEVVQAIIGPQAMATIIEECPAEARAVYLSGADANEQITAALRALLAWRADAVATIASFEKRATDFVAIAKRMGDPSIGPGVMAAAEAEMLRDLIVEGTPA